MKNFTYSILILFLIGFIPTFASSENTSSNEKIISAIKGKNKFVLAEAGKAAPLYVNSKDYPGVLRVAKQLQTDIKSVSGAQPEIIIDDEPFTKGVIVIGTIGKNPLIDKLIFENKIDVKEIARKRETFLIQVIEKPLPNVNRVLVIVGSDKRGTIYGMYELSKQIGVSPWYWWADVPAKKQPNIYIEPQRFTLGEPKIKYRGIFINDEAPALSGWTREKFGGLNSKFYEHVFELIMRLKGNFLWPAMWDNSFATDDPLNPKLADEYGVVIGTSHHEPMMRAWKEWERAGNKKGSWDYAKNKAALQEFWKEGIQRTKDYEEIVTLAMRGDGDEAMNEDANVSQLQTIVEDQRKILADVTKKDVTTIPQVWALYKEVQEYYDKGMRVPDDVTLLLCDDNWGNLRRLPKLDDKSRKGGYGIYYHFDYVGGPRNYKWLNTNQIEKVWEQMHLAYEYGARQIWIVNVGDIKPVEFPIDFFLDYAWNPESITADKLPKYYQDWAAEQFGSKYKNEIAEVLASYTKFNARIKPELLSPDTYSLANYREAETVVQEYNKILAKAQNISNELPNEYKDAFFQLVLHPVQACANLNELYFTVAKNRLYAKQNRVATNDLALKAKKLYQKDEAITNYYNKIMSAGKWNHMMDQTHIGYTYWQQPDNNSMPEVKEITLPDKAEMGVAVEGSENFWTNGNSETALPEFDACGKQNYYIEIFNRGNIPFDYTVQTSEPWIEVDHPNGKVEKEKRLFVSVDWRKAPVGKNKIPITIAGAGKSATVFAVVNNFSKPKVANVFVETNGYVSIEAEHYSRKIESINVSWLTVPGLGKTLSGVTPMPVTSQSQIVTKASPHLEYDVYLSSTGEANVNLYFSPTLNFTNRHEGIRYAISFDDEQPQIMNMTSNPNPPDLNRDPVWNKWVANNINIQVSKHKIEKPGSHILKFWMIDPGVVLQKIVIDNGGVKPSYLGPTESCKIAK